jgi:hypothetical protein
MGISHFYSCSLHLVLKSLTTSYYNGLKYQNMQKEGVGTYHESFIILYFSILLHFHLVSIISISFLQSHVQYYFL